MAKLARAALIAAVVAVFAGPATAADRLDAAARQVAVAKLADAVRQQYVYPDIGMRLADTVSTKLRAGDYDTLSDPAQFAARLQADLYAVAHDKHLNLEAPNSPQPADIPPLPRNEAGVLRAGKLDGEIGYIEVVGFPTLTQFKPVIDRAMASLAGSKAIIVDVRRNYGGTAASVAYLASFFVPQSAHINDIVTRTPNTTDFTRQSFYAEPTPISFAGRPAVVLTSKLTFSGGEEFAYDLQNLKAATVIGEATGGGANPTERMRLTDDLTLFIPRGRAENPVTKSNWEGKGVIPDVRVLAPDAFQVAMKRLGQSAVIDLDAASQIRVYTPRSTPLPGSEAAVRQLIGWMGTSTPDYDALSPQAVERFRNEGAQLREQVRPLGPLRNVKFFQVDPQGGDEYDLTFAQGVRRLGVMLSPDGKILAWNFTGG